MPYEIIDSKTIDALAYEFETRFANGEYGNLSEFDAAIKFYDEAVQRF